MELQSPSSTCRLGTLCFALKLAELFWSHRIVTFIVRIGAGVGYHWRIVGVLYLDGDTCPMSSQILGFLINCLISLYPVAS